MLLVVKMDAIFTLHQPERFDMFSTEGIIDEFLQPSRHECVEEEPLEVLVIDSDRDIGNGLALEWLVSSRPKKDDGMNTYQDNSGLSSTR